MSFSFGNNSDSPLESGRHKIGVIAPGWSIERIINTTKAFENEAEFIPYRFTRLEEVPQIIQRHDSQVNGWLLSGPLPYQMAKWFLKTEDKIAYCRITEAGLLRELLQAAYHQKLILERTSLDFIAEGADVNTMLENIGIPLKEVYIKQYTVPVDENEILRFHLDLLQKSKTECAVTTIPYVYDELTKAGIPVYGIHGSDMEISMAVELVMEKLRSSYFKNAQLGFQIVEVSHYERVIENAKSPYRLQMLELRTKQSLLDYSQDANGYLVDKGYGRYEIFSSRGNIEHNINKLAEALEEIFLELNVPAIAGIGFGETVYLAQVNANKSLQHARVKGGIVAIQGNNEMLELPDIVPLSYSIDTKDKDLIEKLHKAKVGIRSYNRLKASVKRAGLSEFSTSMLATQMGVSDRHIRRMLSGLSEAGLVEYVGEETSGVSGRPGKIYSFR